MKKLIFFALFATILLFIGCSGTNNNILPRTDVQNALVNSTKSNHTRSDDLAFRVSLSQRSSLDIDVEGIVTYLKGTPLVDSLAQQQAIREPWVCYHIEF